MKKILLVLAMCTFLIFGLTACGSSEYDITLSDYENVTISQADIDEQIETIRQYYSSESETITEGTVATGDIVDISYTGTIDGVAFEGGTADNQNLTIGSGQYIEGFEEGLIGAQVGSTLEITLTFPEDYSSTELAGQEAVFEVTVNAIVLPILPEYTDEWVESISEEIIGELITTKADFETQLASYLILEKLFADSVLDDYNEETYDLMVADQLEYYQDYADSNGVDLDTLLSLYGTSQADLEANVLDTLKWQAIIFEIASLENINADEDYEATMLEEAENAGYDSIDEYIEGEEIPDYYIEYTKAYAVYPLVVDLIVSTATIE